MVGTTPLASHFARRELRPEAVHGMEDPAQDAAAAATTAAAAATPTASTPSPGTKARPARASKQRRAHGGEEATEKMLSRLTSKLQEKRKTFAFSFAVEDGSGGEQSSNDSRPLDELVRELEVGDSAKSELERKKKKKKKAKKLAKKGAAKPQVNDQDASGGGCVVVEDDDKAAGADSQASSVPATDTPALPLSADTNQGPIDKGDQAQASRKPLGPPPGLELPDKDDENKPKAKKRRSRKKKNATTKEEEKDVVVLHWDSWKEAATEEEKLRKRFGQGTRNVSAIARRGEKKGVGVIGLAGAAAAKEGGRVSEDGADFGTPLTNAFSFGFAL